MLVKYPTENESGQINIIEITSYNYYVLRSYNLEHMKLRQLLCCAIQQTSVNIFVYIFIFLFILLGVADGVGGWRNYGIDPSHFANSLMATCARMVEQGKFKPQAPAEIISGGYNELLENKDHIIGQHN